MMFFDQHRQLLIAKDTTRSFQLVIAQLGLAFLVLHFHKLSFTFWASIAEHLDFLCIFKEHDNDVTTIATQLPLGHGEWVQDQDSTFTLDTIGDTQTVLPMHASRMSASVTSSIAFLHVGWEGWVGKTKGTEGEGLAFGAG